jgi:hypothetical protein
MFRKQTAYSGSWPKHWKRLRTSRHAKCHMILSYQDLCLQDGQKAIWQ